LAINNKVRTERESGTKSTSMMLQVKKSQLSY